MCIVKKMCCSFREEKQEIFSNKNFSNARSSLEKLSQRENDRMEMHMMQQNQMNSLMQREQYMGPPYAHNGSMKCKLACGQ